MNLATGPLDAELVRQKALCFPLKLKSKQEQNRWASWDCMWSFLDSTCHLSLSRLWQKATEENMLYLLPSPLNTHMVTSKHSHPQTQPKQRAHRWHCFACHSRLFSSCQVGLPFDNFLFPHCFASSILTLFCFLVDIGALASVTGWHFHYCILSSVVRSGSATASAP